MCKLAQGAAAAAAVEAMRCSTAVRAMPPGRTDFPLIPLINHQCAGGDTTAALSWQLPKSAAACLQRTMAQLALSFAAHGHLRGMACQPAARPAPTPRPPFWSHARLASPLTLTTATGQAADGLPIRGVRTRAYAGGRRAPV
eukprot:331059-Chlamydomonas_euryale.AAC.6